MLFVDHDCVHSTFHGYGLVVRGGRNPVVRWLNGRESWVCGNRLRLVSNRKYASVVRNNYAVEAWAYRRVYGVPYPLPLACASFQKPDLLTRLQNAAREPYIPAAEPVQRDRTLNDTPITTDQEKYPSVTTGRGRGRLSKGGTVFLVHVIQTLI